MRGFHKRKRVRDFEKGGKGLLGARGNFSECFFFREIF